ncbi:MAG: endolytic transglycosylase MltG [Lachnospiraceae bacterium]|nr:endolytic transglycosylase MltG [Lachnospiraceae bacterium]
MRNSKIILSIVNSALSVLIFILILFVILKAGTGAYDFGYRIFTETAVDRKPGQDKTVRVLKGMNGMELGSLLEEKGLVESGILFAVQLRLSSYYSKVKPGKYTLNTSQTAEEMIQILAGEEIEEKEE